MPASSLQDVLAMIVRDASARWALAVSLDGLVLASSSPRSDADLAHAHVVTRAASRKPELAGYWQGASGAGHLFAVWHESIGYAVLFDDADSLSSVARVTLAAIGKEGGPALMLPPGDKGGSGSTPLQDELYLPRIRSRRAN